MEVEANVRAENGVNLIVQSIEGLDGDALLDLSDRFKQKHAPAAVVLGGVDDGKVTLIANFDQAVADKVSASDVVRAAAALVGGGGGGRPTMARAGRQGAGEARRRAGRSRAHDPRCTLIPPERTR